MSLLKRIHSLLLLCCLLLAAGMSLARAEVVLVVAASSPVNSLTPNQVADIFLGRTDRLPGNIAVVPVDYTEHAKEREEFYRRYLNRSPAQIRAYWAKQVFTGKGEPPMAIDNTEQLKRFIAGHPGAIGYLDREKVDSSLKAVSVSKE